MSNSALDTEALRALVRQHVVAALRRLEEEKAPRQAAAAAAPAGGNAAAASFAAAAGTPRSASRRLLALFMGRQEADGDFMAQLASLIPQGFGLAAAFSHSFSRCFSPDAVLVRLPAGAVSRPQLSSELEMLAAVGECHAVVAGTLSLNTAAKLSLGIDDSLPAFVISQALLAGKPVFVARELSSFGPQLDSAHPRIPPAMRRTAEDHLHKVQQLGVQFVAASGLASALTEQFAERRNETPERLARQRPTPKRQFITAEDVWEAASRGQKELVHSPDAVVTDQARDFAAVRGIALKCS